MNSHRILLIPIAALAIVMLAAAPAAADEWKVVGQAETRSMPWGVSVSPDGESVYVTHVGMRGRDNVYRYDARTLEVVARSRFPGHAVESVLAGERLYVSNSRSHVVMVLDADDLSVIERLSTGRVPKDIALSPDQKTLYSADWRDGAVSFIDIASGRAHQVKTGWRTRGVTVSRDGETVYAAVFGKHRVVAIDASTRQIETRIDACKKPRHLAVTRDDRHLLVTCFGGREVLVIARETHEIVRRVQVGDGPKTIALSPDGRFAVTADERADSVTFIDLETFASRSQPVPVKEPCGADIASDGRRVYITGRGSHEMIVLEKAE